METAGQSRTGSRSWPTWLVAVAIPAVGLLELLAHFVQTCGVVPERDWKSAREYVATAVGPDDLIAFAPRWADPIGREYFGSGLMTLEREARADETRFPRAFEVSIRGAHVGLLAGWRRVDRRSFGRVVVSTLENPAPAPVLADLVLLVDPEHLRASVVDGDRELDCTFQRTGSALTGGLGAGQPLPADRFACPAGGVVGTSIVADLDFFPHRCIYAPPPGAVLRLRFAGVPFGRRIRGHHSLYVQTETAEPGTPVTSTFVVNGTVVGRATHRDHEGWQAFEFDTSALAGSRADLVVEVASGRGERRPYCFEATTR